MRDCLLAKCVVAYVAIVSLSLSSLLAQEVPKSDDESFDIEPPLLVKPWEPQSAPDDSGEDAVPLDAAKLAQRLEGAKKSAAATARLVKSGVLSTVEAEQRALRVVRLESELAKAQMISAQQQLTSLKARFLAGQASQPEVDAATTAVTQASAAAQEAGAKYHKAQLDAAELNLRRQRQLLKLGSAHKSDVAHAEEKLANSSRATKRRIEERLFSPKAEKTLGANGADGITDIEGKVARLATSKLGNERVSNSTSARSTMRCSSSARYRYLLFTARIDRFIAEGGKGPYPDME